MSDRSWSAPLGKLMERILPTSTSCQDTPEKDAAPRPEKTAPTAVENPRVDDAVTAVPWLLRVSAAVAWRLIIVVLASGVVIWGLWNISTVVLPIAIAALLTVLLNPLVVFLHRKARVPKGIASLIALLLTVAVVGGSLTTAGTQILSQMPNVLTRANQGFSTLISWLKNNPFGWDTSALDTHLASIQTEAVTWVQNHAGFLASGALAATSSVASVATGFLIMLFCLFFFLKDGREIWVWCVRLLPVPAREPVHEAAIRGWNTVGGYVIGQIAVSFIDAVSIGIGAYFLGVPLVVPIVLLVFFGSFVPILGSLMTGIIAVMVALVDQGLTVGIIMLVIIVLVHEVEGNILQPLLMSNAVSLHPLAIMLVVTGGAAVAGIPGAVFAVPIVAFVNAAVLYLHGHDPAPELAHRVDRPGGAPGTLQEQIVRSYKHEGVDAGADAKKLSGKVEASDAEADEECAARENEAAEAGETPAEGAFAPENAGQASVSDEAEYSGNANASESTGRATDGE